MVLAAAFVVLCVENFPTWSGVRIPRILWVNTLVLLASSGTLELARRKLPIDSLGVFGQLWALTTAMGLLFVNGQANDLRQLLMHGVYLTFSQRSSFFYVFTTLNGIH